MEKRQWAQNIWNKKTLFYYTGDLTTGPVCPDRLWWLRPWGSSRLKWTQTWATCCDWLCFEQRLELDDPQMPLPTSSILRFCGCPSYSYKSLTFFFSFCMPSWSAFSLHAGMICFAIGHILRTVCWVILFLSHLFMLLNKSQILFDKAFWWFFGLNVTHYSTCSVQFSDFSVTFPFACMHCLARFYGMQCLDICTHRDIKALLCLRSCSPTRASKQTLHKALSVHLDRTK